MKIYLYFLLTLLLAACGSKQQTEGEKPVITVSIEPLRYFTVAIAGDRCRVISLVHEGSRTETYDATHEHRVGLNECCDFLCAGYTAHELLCAG